MLTYIDTHSHLYDNAFSGEVDEAVKRALDAGVGTILQPDIDSSERPGMIELQRRFPDVFKNMAGLYPGSVDENWEKEMAETEAFANTPGIIGIGEIGLDYHYSADTAELQKKALLVQFEMASRLNLPVDIHLRDATEDFFKVLEECKGLNIKGCMHAFSGSAETFRRLQKYGDWHVGIGGIVTFKNARLAETVKEIPLDRIVLETDSPYMAPVPLRGTRNESANIPIIAAKIAELKGIGLSEVAETTTLNAERLFNL